MSWHIKSTGTIAEIQAALNALVVDDAIEAQQFETVKEVFANSVGLGSTTPNVVVPNTFLEGVTAAEQSKLQLLAEGHMDGRISRVDYRLSVVKLDASGGIIGTVLADSFNTTTIAQGGGGAGGDGLIWGPNPEVADLIDGQGDSFLNHFPGSNYTTLSFGNPVTVNNDIDFGASSLMTSLEFRNLVSVAGAILCSEAALLEEFLAPSLQTVGNDINLALDVNLTSLSLPSLVTCGGEFALTDTALETLSLPLLVTVGGNVSWDGTNLSSVFLPSLVTTSGSVDLSNSLSLVTFSAPNWLPETDGSFDFSGCALNAASVEHILRRCMVAGCDNASIEIQGGTNAGYASLSAQGQQDADDLTTAGNSVTLNP